MITPVDALNDLSELMTNASFRGSNIYDKARMLDDVCEGLGKLYMHYMIQTGKPSDFIVKATELIVANSTKLGRILR